MGFASSACFALCLGILCGFAISQDSKGAACREIEPCYCLGSRVHCEKKQLTAIPAGIPTDITALDLSYNNIEHLDSKQLLRFTSLRELYLHHNNIKIVPSWDSFPSTLTTLSLHHNKIGSIASFNKSKQHVLRNLFLNNNKISSIDDSAFVNLSNLQVLKLNKNKLTLVPSIALSHLNSLRTLDLSRNSLRFISPSSFRRLTALQTLRLSKNKISVVRGAYWGLDKLEQVYLDRNNFTTVETSWFFGLQSLQNLYLQNNKISTITTKFADWRSFPVLRKLNLAKNKLSHISDQTFNHLLALKVLNLASNHIYHITGGSFSDLHLLEALDLSNNDISWTVEEMNGPFRGLRNLASLRLDGNRITAIAATAFIGMENLKFLNLSANIITSIEENSFQEMKKLQILWLNTSHLMCDCKLKWLGGWLRSKPFALHTVRARCLHPQQLQMKSVFNVTPSAFVCDTSNPIPKISVHPTSQKAMRGDNITLHCRVQVFQRNNTGVRLEWRQDYEVISDGDITNHAKTVDEDVVTYISDLSLTTVDFVDAGLYQCIASNKYGSKYSKKARLDVYQFPTLTRKPIDLTVQAGGLIKLPCAATGYPDPTITWRKDDGTKFPAAIEKRMTHHPTEDLFMIKNAKAKDMGSYTCSATNEAGTVNATAFVTVLEEPRFTQHMVSKRVRVGESAVLKCLASGSPTPRITWYKDRVEIAFTARVLTLKGQLLVIVAVQPDDEGTYTCEVSNTLGTVRQTAELIVTTGSDPLKRDEEKEARYDKKTFLGIIVIAIVSCVVGTSLVWLLVIYCAKRGSHRRHKLRRGPFHVDTTDATSSKNAHRDELSYIPLKSSSSGSTQTSRDSPRSTATFLASTDSQGTTFPISASGSDTNSGSDKTSTAGNISSENSLKGSHCSLSSSSCHSDDSEPLRQVVHVQIHSSDSDSEKCKTQSPARRKVTTAREDIPESSNYPSEHCGTSTGECGTSAGPCRTFRGFDTQFHSNDSSNGPVVYIPMECRGVIVRTPDDLMPPCV